MATAKYQHLRPDKDQERTQEAIRRNPFDIALCCDHLCPSRGRCYRYEREAGEHYTLVFPRDNQDDCPYGVFVEKPE